MQMTKTIYTRQDTKIKQKFSFQFCNKLGTSTPRYGMRTNILVSRQTKARSKTNQDDYEGKTNQCNY